MISRTLAETVFREAIAACDPAALVAQAIAAMAPGPPGDVPRQGFPRVTALPVSEGGVRSITREEPAQIRVGISVGKAALAMAQGAGPVKRGIVVAPHAGNVPDGWRALVGSHPEPDERSVAAGRAIAEVVDGATDRECGSR